VIKLIVAPLAIWAGGTKIYENGAIKDDRIVQVLSEEERKGLDRSALDERIDGARGSSPTGLINYPHPPAQQSSTEYSDPELHSPAARPHRPSGFGLLATIRIFIVPLSRIRR